MVIKINKILTKFVYFPLWTQQRTNLTGIYFHVRVNKPNIVDVKVEVSVLTSLFQCHWREKVAQCLVLRRMELMRLRFHMKCKNIFMHVQF